MNYQVNQQNYFYNPGDPDRFAEPLTGGEVKTITSSDINVSGTIGYSFDNPQIDFSRVGGLEQSTPYYFHTKIFRLDSVQTFNISLIKVDDATGKIILSQFIKTITVKEGAGREATIQNPNTDFVDVEGIITPIVPFDGIMFELQRTEKDLIISDPSQPTVVTGRVPVIGYIEVSKVVNNIPSTPHSEIAKLGVQSRPGLMMCINKEEIHIPKSGIFELRDGIIRINFFSVVSGQTPINKEQNYLTNQMNTPYSEIVSTSFLSEEFAGQKERIISNFTLDYLYQS